MNGVARLALDLGIRSGDRGNGNGQGVIRPAGQLAASAIDLPGRHTQILGTHAPPAPQGGYTGQLTDLHRQGGDDRHWIGAGGDGVTQSSDGLGDVARRRRIRHGEAGGLESPRVVGVDRLEGDGALCVGDELIDGRAQLAQIGAEGVDQRADGLGLHTAAHAARIRAHERGLVLGRLDSLNGHHRVGRLGQGVEELSAALSAVVAQQDDDVGGWSGDVGQQVRQQRVVHLLQGGHQHELRLAEERGGREGVELVRLIGGGLDRADLGGGVLLTRLSQKPAHRAVGEDLLARADEDDRCEVDLVPGGSFRCAPGASGGASGRCHGASLPRSAEIPVEAITGRSQASSVRASQAGPTGSQQTRAPPP